MHVIFKEKLSNTRTLQLRDMGREQRKMDAKLRKAEADSSTIDRERREVVNKVEGYQRAVDRATEEMSKSPPPLCCFLLALSSSPARGPGAN